jgi:nucleoside-diphosphate-sugar epimerase
MKILIIGGAGLLGLELAEAYSESGDEVALCDNFSGSITYRTPRDYKLFTANACEPSALSNSFKHFNPEKVIVALNYCFNRDIVYNPYEDSRTILHSTSAVCSALPKSVKKLIFCSSHEVYGGPEPKQPLKESRKIVVPATAHGAAKLASEGLLKFHCNDRGIALINARLFNIYGSRVKFTPRSCLINFLVDSFLREECVGIVDPDIKRDFIHAEDAACAMHLVDASGFSGNVNVGSGTGTTLRKLVPLISRHLEIKEPPVFLNKCGGYSSVANIELLSRIVPSWKPLISLENYLPELVEFRRAELEFFSLKDPTKALNTMRGKI